jgi:AraC-like DNA-binding protein
MQAVLHRGAAPAGYRVELAGGRVTPTFPSHLFATQIFECRYYCPEVPRALGGLTVVCAGWEACRPDYELVRRTFPWVVVELVVRGEGWLELDDRRYPLRPGSLFCYGSETSLRITTDPARPFLKYFVGFTGSEAHRASARGALRVGEAREAVYPEELQQVLDRVIAEGNRKSSSSSEIANDYLRIFLLKLDECAAESSAGEPSRALDSYLRAKAFLEKNYLRLRRTDDAAHELGMATETLCRLFQHYSRTSPHQFVLRLRINLAVDLLLGTNLLVKEVAEQAGFDDPFHFSRVFRRVQGVSPAAFQKLHRRDGRA